MNALITLTSIKTVRQQNKEREDRERSARYDREREEKSARPQSHRAGCAAGKCRSEPGQSDQVCKGWQLRTSL